MSPIPTYKLECVWQAFVGLDPSDWTRTRCESADLGGCQRTSRRIARLLKHQSQHPLGEAETKQDDNGYIYII